MKFQDKNNKNCFLTIKDSDITALRLSEWRTDSQNASLVVYTKNNTHFMVLDDVEKGLDLIKQFESGFIQDEVIVADIQ